MFGRKKIAMILAEFLGTGILTLVVLSVQRSTIGVPFFIAAAAGLAVTALTFALASTSGAHLNPAVTIALWTARKVETVQAALYVVVQLLGAWAAYGLYTYFVNSTLQTIGGTHFTARVLVAEAVGAAIFAFAWAAAVYQRFELTTTALVVGVAFMLGVIVAAAASVGLINPALALGTRAWEFNGSTGWSTYALGPVLGAIVGVNLYAMVFVPQTATKTAALKAKVTTKAKTTRKKK